ncbi:hypothetical protein ACFQ1S_10890 [Kibdelosporangium lantanae]|uniref:Uncharacterized protein n=1 Tax=Kibdelosporangium lantanae TaxID=1497396 RepID=A0ABW3M6T3_9PSEU
MCSLVARAGTLSSSGRRSVISALLARVVEIGAELFVCGGDPEIVEPSGGVPFGLACCPDGVRARAPGR